MRLFSLVKGLNFRALGNLAVDILGLYHKDTEVKEGGLFFCLKGTNVDGSDYVFSAIKNGAVAIVAEKEIHGVGQVVQIIVKNAREAMSKIASKFYGNPASKLKIIGVTGTNGKTTITNMIASVVKNSGQKVAIIGTNGVFIGAKKYETNMTTPDPIELQKYFSLMLKNNIKYVAIEVSAHAAALNKVDGIKFEVMIFSNLTQDHLDFFKTMDNYFLAKKKLFCAKFSKLAVINSCDNYAQKLIEGINIPYLTYSTSEKSDFFVEILSISYGKQKIKINGEIIIDLPMLGGFNSLNALATIAALSSLGFSNENIKNGLELMRQVDGRFNSIIVDEKTIIIDYAHTPDGLENILNSAREIAEENNLFCIFGCGGNRDKSKRLLMGEIASRICDYIFVTKDNPRFEDAKAIANDIVKGIKNQNYEIELDRAIAIKKAILKANKNDVIVLAGKGAEDYIEENGVKIPYSDKEEVEKFRRNL